MKSNWRFFIVVLLLGSAALLLQVRNTHEIIPDHAQLASFPREFAGWTTYRDIPMSKDTLAVLGPGDFLLRDYVNDAGTAGLNLFVAYFPSQRAGDTIHSPKNCLPGAGWAPIRSDRIIFSLRGRAPFPVNRYVVAQGDQKQLVLYWYFAHDRAVASEYAAKLYLVTDSIRMRRSDGSLIRLVAPISGDRDLESTQNLLISFAGQVMSSIDAYVPR
jgi:EpsI family protein